MTFLTPFKSAYFSGSVPEVEISCEDTQAMVTVTVDKGLSTETVILDETLFPVNGVIRLHDLAYEVGMEAEARLLVTLTIDVEDTSSSSISQSTNVYYFRGDMTDEPSSYCASHFLTMLNGDRTTSLGRLEYLHFIGGGSPSVKAIYSDGTTSTFTPSTVSSNGNVTTINVSPDAFVTAGKTLVGYTVTAGSRSQRYIIDLENPDVAPVLLFVNSFGCQELAYCTGKHEKSSEFKRSSSYIDGKIVDYHIEETPSMKADTGILSHPMADWWDEVFRSNDIHVVNFTNGNANVGSPVTITEVKNSRSNEDDALPRFTFTWRYAQRNQFVVESMRAGRIFDNTFDNTFN